MSDYPPLVDRCLDLMECAEGCATRDEERRLMQEVIYLVRSEDAKDRRDGAGSNPVAGTTTGTRDGHDTEVQ